jgi:hypothetical protein
MITKVKIAPAEQWCDAYVRLAKQHPSMLRMVGMEVEIISDAMEFDNGSMHPEPCRLWPVSPVTIEKLNRAVGAKGNAGGLRLCEHILEMD